MFARDIAWACMLKNPPPDSDSPRPYSKYPRVNSAFIVFQSMSGRLDFQSHFSEKMVWAIPDFGYSLVSDSRCVSPPRATTVESVAFRCRCKSEKSRNMENHARNALSQCQLFLRGRRRS